MMEDGYAYEPLAPPPCAVPGGLPAKPQCPWPPPGATFDLRRLQPEPSTKTATGDTGRVSRTTARPLFFNSPMEDTFVVHSPCSSSRCSFASAFIVGVLQPLQCSAPQAPPPELYNNKGGHPASPSRHARWDVIPPQLRTSEALFSSLATSWLHSGQQPGRGLNRPTGS